MIIIHWTVPLLAVVLGAAAAFWAVTRWRNRIDALVLGRVDAVLTAVLGEVLEREEPGLEPGLMPPVDPWSSWQTLHDGLPDTTAPELPDHTWWGKGTGLLPIVPVEAPDAAVVDGEAAALVAEAVAEEPKSDPRKRFNKKPRLPKPPREIAVAAVIPDAEVLPEKVQVPA